MDRRLLFAFHFLVLFVFSCNSNSECNLRFNEFPKKSQAPYIFITGINSSCNYTFSGTFWLNRGTRTVNGILYKDDRSIQLQLDSTIKSRVTYFDFTKPIGEDYLIKIDLGADSDTFVGHIDQRISLNDGSEVFMFRIVNGYSSHEMESDLVFFVTKGEGIIGSYISEIENSDEWVIETRGDILRNTIDYSKKRFGIIE